ncbi:hypothetical protein V6N11_079495 [Hibiscus sabdariffa]
MSSLEESCLLLDSNTDENFFDVHDLTYIVAKSIVSKDNQVFVLKEDDVMTDWPDEESLKKLNKICLLYPNKLPDELNCPQLFHFLIYGKDQSLTLPDDFFKEATNLKVLDLTRMQFSSLPSSIRFLTSLTTLHQNCTKEIGQLVKLKLLDVSHCAKLKTIANGVLSSLTRLEELHMGGTSIQWGQSSTASLAELNTLSRLSTLVVRILDAKAMPQDFFQELQKLESYKIFIGEGWKWDCECRCECFGNYHYSRTINLKLSIDDLDRGIKKFLMKTESLHLDELKGVKIALQELPNEDSLSDLKNLHIQNGLDIEYIINGENEFPQLESLTLQNLPQLISFCPQHKANVTSSLPQHEVPLFSEKISFPYLEKLWLKSINVIRIWYNQLSSTSFRTYEKLTTLKIEGCGSLRNLFSFSMTKCLVHLTDFEIIGCNCLREVIFMEEIEEETQATMTLSLFPQLKSLVLMDLQHMIGFCSDFKTQIIEFPAMKSLRIDNCPELESFICRSSMEGSQLIPSQVLIDNKAAFPSLEEMIAGDLPQLSDLIINGCGGEEIVSKVEEISDSETIVSFEFDQLSFLRLWGLSECKCFYPGRHTTKWPMLKDLEAYKCGEMKIFGTQLITKEQLDSPPPLFLVEKVIPKLQRLSIGGDYIALISGAQFSSNLFHEIITFKVEGNRTQSVDFQISFLERFYNLKELCISDCEIKELFCTEEDTGNKGTYAGTLSTIRKLELTDLPNLKHHLWKQDVQVDHILPKLETLQVHSCENLMSLGSSSAPFQSLTTLEVWECKGMEYLDTCVAVQGLSQLKKLIIGECISVKETVASEEDEATRDIIFSRLKSLELVNLPRLKSFCLGNHTFGFPCLEEVIVSCCPEFEIFCKGILNAPLLQSVEYGNDKRHWGGDINSTVQQLHSTKVGYQGIEYLVLSEFAKSIEIWKEKSLDFKNLRVLEIEKCSSLKYIFSVSMALELVQLKDLKVKNCAMMEYIVKKGTEETTIDTLLLPKLWSIKLESCSELTSFCKGSITLQCPSLKSIRVDDCPKMYAMACTREVGGGEKTPFFNDKLLKLSSTNIQKLWPDKPHSAILSNVQNLQLLSVKGCHNLEYLFPSVLIKYLVRLSTLALFDCHNMKQVTFTEDEGMSEIYLFTELKLLGLSGLPKVKTFCHGDNSETDDPALFNQKVRFPSLSRLMLVDMGDCRKIWQDKVTMGSFYEFTLLRVKRCERLSNILPFSMVERLQKLETLQICKCESVERIIGPEDDHRLNSNESHEATPAESIELKSTIKFVFPKIRKLEFQTLPKLEGFYSKVHTTEWPSLKQLEVSACSMVESLAREYINFGETQGERQPLLSVQQPLFWITENGNMKEIWHRALPNKYFSNLRRLKLIGSLEASVTIPNCFVQSLPNLDNFSVENNAVNELIPCEGLMDEDEHAGTLAHLKELRLSELPELTHLSKKEVSLAQVLCNLEFLQVIECRN